MLEKFPEKFLEVLKKNPGWKYWKSIEEIPRVFEAIFGSKSGWTLVRMHIIIPGRMNGYIDVGILMDPLIWIIMNFLGISPVGIFERSAIIKIGEIGGRIN